MKIKFPKSKAQKRHEELMKVMEKINKNLEALADCTTTSSRGYGRRRYIITGHWND